MSASTGILLALCERSAACLARTSISARLAFHWSRQLKVDGELSACVRLEIRNGHLAPPGQGSEEETEEQEEKRGYEEEEEGANGSFWRGMRGRGRGRREEGEEEEGERKERKRKRNERTGKERGRRKRKRKA